MLGCGGVPLRAEAASLTGREKRLVALIPMVPMAVTSDVVGSRKIV